MALPTDTTDPGTTGAETQAFGVGVRVDVTPGNVVSTTWPATGSPNNTSAADQANKGSGVASNINVG